MDSIIGSTGRYKDTKNIRGKINPGKTAKSSIRSDLRADLSQIEFHSNQKLQLNQFLGFNTTSNNMSQFNQSQKSNINAKLMSPRPNFPKISMGMHGMKTQNNWSNNLVKTDDSTSQSQISSRNT